MMTDDDRRRLAAAFWHRGRKCAVPLTSAELDERLGDGRALRQAGIAAGLVRREQKSVDRHLQLQIYDLTEAGKAWLPFNYADRARTVEPLP